MADFIVNSTENKAVRKASVVSVGIEPHNNGYMILLKVGDRPLDVVFETDETQEGIQTKAAVVINALES